MILIDENNLTYGCIELIASSYGIRIPYADDEQYKQKIEEILERFRVKGE